MKRKILYTVLVIAFIAFITGCTSKKENSSQSSDTKEKQTYEYKEGVLTPIVDEDGNVKQKDFIINGLILIGNRHSYEVSNGEETIESFVKKGYQTKGINSSFYLNEYIEFYIDTDYSGSTSDVKIITVPHKSVEEYEKMSLSKLEDFSLENGGFVLEYKEPDKDNYKYVDNGYVNIDNKEGKYDILFTYKGKLAYYLPITLTKEKVE